MDIRSIASIGLPWWARLGAVAAACLFSGMLGMLHGERTAGERHLQDVRAQATQTVKVAHAQVQVVHTVEVKYRDRIKTVYVQGEQIENRIPEFVTPADNVRFGVNAGFVRILDAAWAGAPAPAAAESDREPAGVPLADIAANEADNATACRAWREQALGLREFYAKLRAVTQPAGGSAD